MGVTARGTCYTRGVKKVPLAINAAMTGPIGLKLGMQVGTHKITVCQWWGAMIQYSLARPTPIKASYWCYGKPHWLW